MPGKVLKTTWGYQVYRWQAKLEARFFGFKTQRIDIGEMELDVNIATPTKPKATILLIHGFSADKSVWTRCARHLAKDYRVIVPDLAGHGETGYQPDWDYTAPANAQRLALMLDKLGVNKVHVAGNSMGGFIAAHFARLFPQRTLSAGLIDPVGVKSPQQSVLEVKLDQGNNVFLVHTRSEYDDFFAMAMSKPPWIPGFVHSGLAVHYQQRRDELKAMYPQLFFACALDDQLAEITPPALLLWGREDQIIDVSATKVWAAGLPNVAVDIWDDIGHMPMVEQPRRAAERYRKFIEGVNT